MALQHVTLASALQAIVVGCADGWLYLLDIESGRQQVVVDTAGAIKSPPVVDSWQGWGCLWMASHGKQLLACSSQGEVLQEACCLFAESHTMHNAAMVCHSF